MIDVLKDESVVIFCLNNPCFLKKLANLNISVEEIIIYHDFLVVKISDNPYYIMFDKNYDIIEIFYKDFDELTLLDKWHNYKNSKLSYPFTELTLIQFYNICSNFDIKLINDGRVLKVISKNDNSEVTSQDEKSAICYIFFLQKLLQEYLSKYIHLSTIGIVLPNIVDFINKNLNVINNELNNKIAENKIINASSFLKSLGLENNKENFMLAHNVVIWFLNKNKDTLEEADVLQQEKFKLMLTRINLKMV